MIEEKWLPVVGYEGLYEVSSLGRVRSLPRNTTKGKILTQQITKFGYLKVALAKNNVPKFFQVHRLVAISFIPNPNNLPQVNHINENKLDNRVENLEWCTAKYNMNYSNSKRVAQYTLSGELVAIYSSLREASNQTGFWYGNISRCCLGKRKTAYGYIWKYID